jgi:chemotaxis response regulator CheB
MAKAPKPDLDEATVQIARQMLSMPPKPHDEMKLGRKEKKRRRGVAMVLQIEPDVLSMVEFMQSNISASHLAATAEAVAALGPVIWGHHEQEEVIPARLLAEPISRRAPHRRQAAT